MIVILRRLPRESSLVQSLDPEKVNLVSAQIASFLVCYTLVRLGYCIGLQKSRNPVPYLGFQCDSRFQAFCLLSHKKQKFISLVEAILKSSHVSITDLQRLAGKCFSRSMAVPGARSTWPFPVLPALPGHFLCRVHCAVKLNTRSTWPFPVLPALPGHFLCRVHCAVKLNTGFSLSPGQASFLFVRSDTTNLSYLLIPLPTAGLEF